MAFDPRVVTIGDYFAAEWDIICAICKRHETVTKWRMNQDFGPDITLQEAARRLAAATGCSRAAAYHGAGCNVIVSEIDVIRWASLRDAQKGKWRAYLVCHRRHAALKSVKSCPERTELDIETMCITFGDGFKIDRLPRKCRCPGCGTDFVDIEWYVPQIEAKPDVVRPVTIEDLREREFKRRAGERR